MNPNKRTAGHIIIKMTKIKEKDSKGSKTRAKSNYKGTPIRLSADFYRNNASQKEWQYIFEVLNGKSLQAEILYTARLSFRRIKLFRQAKTCPNRNIER